MLIWWQCVAGILQTCLPWNLHRCQIVLVHSATGRHFQTLKPAAMQGRRLFQQPSTWYKAMRAHLSKGWSLSRRIIKAAVRKLRTTAVDFWDLVGPGGKLHPEEFIEHNGDVLVQLLLGAVVAYLAVQKSFKPSAKYDAPLTEQVRA